MDRRNVTNWWKRKKVSLVSCAMAFALALSGCGGNPGESPGESGEDTESYGENTAKGRYMESAKTIPEGLTNLESMVRLSDGSIGIADKMSGVFHLSKDEGETWETKEISPLIEVINQDSAEVTSIALAPDGGLFFSYVLWSGGVDENGNVAEQYVYMDAQGQSREVPLQSKQEDYILEQAVFGGDGNLYLVYLTGQVYRADLNTGELTGVMKIKGQSTVFTSSGDYIICGDMDEISLFKISTGEKLETDSVLNDFYSKEIAAVYNIGILVDDADGQIYTASGSGLYGHVPGGSVMDELLSGELSNMGDPTRKAVSLLKGKDGGFLVAYSDGEIDSYIYDKDAPAVPEQQLTIYSLTENDTISKAVSTFRKNHPDVFVKQEIGITDEASMVAEDAIRNLNASLLSGEGPDIIVLDGMPRDAYIEKGQLKDLKEFAEKLEGEGSYFKNILHAYDSEEGLYALPTRFTIPVAAGDKEILGDMKTLEDLADAVVSEREKKPGQGTVLGTYTPEELLAILQNGSAPAWMKDGKFDKGAVESYLTQALRIYEAEHANITPEQEQMRAQYTETVDFGMSYAEYNSNLNVAAAFNIMGKEASFIVGNLNSADGVKMLVSLMKQTQGVEYTLMPGQSEKVFCPRGIVGINAGTKDEDTALEFLTALFSEDVLKNDLNDGYPVNEKAFDEFFADPSGGEKNEGFSASSEGGEIVSFSISWPTKEEVESLKNLVGTLSCPGDVESILKDAVADAGEKVLTGEISPQEGADEIGQKMELYFAE